SQISLLARLVALGLAPRLQGAALGRAQSAGRSRPAVARGTTPPPSGLELARRLAGKVRGLDRAHRNLAAPRAGASGIGAARTGASAGVPARHRRRGAESATRSAEYLPGPGSLRSCVD